ncbi:hypothetical protein EVAR_95641_1 [Eumeta japonica]|uniref:Uncharacterized protein n=1 Tax=Eumeta variegata TaxID=151549 RepID=A0A4C2AGJ7_EUMVA|nr:hypothetical protein EVAR_95641_1 [Eumeta japonica]
MCAEAHAEWRWSRFVHSERERFLACPVLDPQTVQLSAHVPANRRRRLRVKVSDCAVSGQWRGARGGRIPVTLTAAIKRFMF